MTADRRYSRFLRACAKLLGFALLLGVVVWKLQAALPRIGLGGWVVLGAAFVLATFLAMELSRIVQRRTGMSRDAAEWAAVVLICVLAGLVGLLMWDWMSSLAIESADR